MLKMIIRMDDNKILNERKYCLDGIYSAIDSMFKKLGLSCMEDASGDFSKEDLLQHYRL